MNQDLFSQRINVQFHSVAVLALCGRGQSEPQRRENDSIGFLNSNGRKFIKFHELRALNMATYA